MAQPQRRRQTDTGILSFTTTSPRRTYPRPRLVVSWRRSTIQPDNVFCMPAAVLMSYLATASAGAVILHPPADTAVDVSSDNSAIDQQVGGLVDIGHECARVLRPGGVVLAMGETRVMSAWHMAAEYVDLLFMDELVVAWDRPPLRPRAIGSVAGQHMLVRRYVKPGHRPSVGPLNQVPPAVVRSSFLICEPIDDPITHAQLPVQLYNYLITQFTGERDLVVDPMSGTGSSLVAAADSGRPWIGGDVSIEMVKTARERTEEGRVELEMQSAGEIRYFHVPTREIEDIQG